MAGSGLVGIVTQTGPHIGRRSAASSTTKAMSAAWSSPHPTECMVRGDLSLIADGKIRFEQLENNDNEIQVGEQIVTSHISDKYLQGILVGYISEINVDANNLTQFRVHHPGCGFPEPAGSAGHHDDESGDGREPNDQFQEE